MNRETVILGAAAVLGGLLSCAGECRAQAAFRGLGDLPGSTFHSVGQAISSDGSVVVGMSKSTHGTEAYRWTASGGMEGLGALPGVVFSSSSYAVSADGSVVVGQSLGQGGQQAFRWTRSEGMVPLGQVAAGFFAIKASGVSADGSTIVGYGTSANGTEAFRWSAAAGPRSGAWPGRFRPHERRLNRKDRKERTADSQTRALGRSNSVSSFAFFAPFAVQGR